MSVAELAVKVAVERRREAVADRDRDAEHPRSVDRTATCAAKRRKIYRDGSRGWCGRFTRRLVVCSMLWMTLGIGRIGGLGSAVWVAEGAIG